MKAPLLSATSRFEDLRVYQLSEKLSDLIWTIVRGWQPMAIETLGNQLVRSADSIGANIAEGTGRGSFQDNKRFIRIARGSLFETKHWLRRAFRRGLIDEHQVKELKALLDPLGPSLNAYLRSIGSIANHPDETMPNARAATPNDDRRMTKDK